MNYQSVYTVGPRTGATGTWSLDGTLIPNPFSFGYADAADSVSANSLVTEFVNRQIPGDTHPERLNNFLGDFQRWRLAYASVTIYQDGPDLSNQGTVVACQRPMELPSFTAIGTGDTSQDLVHRCFVYRGETDAPDYTVSQSMPNAYFGRSKDGIYMPLKLTETHQKWHSAKDLTMQSSRATFVSYTDTDTGGMALLPMGNDPEELGFVPFPSLNDAHRLDESGNRGPIMGTVTSAFCNQNWGQYSFRNMSVNTSLSFFFRFGFEVQVPPSSAMAPHLRLSPEFDPTALNAYFMVARELKDAYPSDYNDLGKIWDVISSVAKALSPAFSMLPVVGPFMPAAITGLTAVGDAVRKRAAAKRVSQSTLGNTASQADKERLRAQRVAPVVRPRLNVRRRSG